MTDINNKTYVCSNCGSDKILEPYWLYVNEEGDSAIEEKVETVAKEGYARCKNCEDNWKSSGYTCFPVIRLGKYVEQFMATNPTEQEMETFYTRWGL